jgi:hypothetical protein
MIRTVLSELSFLLSVDDCRGFSCCGKRKELFSVHSSVFFAYIAVLFLLNVFATPVDP